MVGSSAAETDPLLGSLLGKDYRVLERIGQGGMAVVYLVEHQTLLKRFAAKVLSHEAAASSEARARFTQEAHAASQLDHENIVSISDFGITPDGRPFFVMELLRGKTLADRIDEGAMTLEEVVAVSVPVARALAHAHAEGIIHRDVKPENIFLVQRSQGRWGVKVLDFGIAKVPVNDRMTKTGEALGSPMYMAPEACRGEEVDQRADVYSFGIVLYLMLAGRVPFADENLLKVLQMQVAAPLPLPTSFNPDLPASLEIVVIRALAKEPADRYDTMEEFLFALEAALPEGSDALLIQAQFGTQTTPFPGTLDRVRQSGRFSKPPYAITGEHEAAAASTSRPASLPPAPAKKRGRTALIVGTLLVLGAAGAGGYAWLQYSQQNEPAIAPRVAAAVPAPSVTPPAPAAPSAQIETPPVVDTAGAPATAPSPEPDKPEKAQRSAPARPSGHAAPVTTKTKASSSNAHEAAPPAPVAPAQPAIVEEPAPRPAEVQAPRATPTPLPVPEPPPLAATPVAPPKPAPAPVAVGSMDAMPTIANLDINGPLPNSVVRRGVERVLPALRACYRTAAGAQKKTPALSMSLNFEIDESSAATNISAGGASFGSLASCARNAIGQVQTQQAPDVGTAQVALVIKFTPL